MRSFLSLVAIVVGVACGAGVALVLSPLNVMGVAVQAAVITSGIGWIRRSSPRVVRGARAWIPTCTVTPLALGTIANRSAAHGTVAAAGTVGLVMICAAIAYGRARRGRCAAVAVMATGPTAAAMVVPVAGPWWPAAASVVIGGASATAAALAVTTIGAEAPSFGVQPAPQHRSPWRAGLVTAVGVGAGEVIGMALFPTHPAWVPLTCFVVLAAAAAGSSTLWPAVRRATARLVGAVGGAVVGVVGALVVVASAACEAVTIGLVVVFVAVGALLRPYGYAWRVGGLTAGLVVASSTDAWSVGVDRLAAIATGGAIALGVVASDRLLPSGPAGGQPSATPSPDD